MPHVDEEDTRFAEEDMVSQDETGRCSDASWTSDSHGAVCSRSSKVGEVVPFWLRYEAPELLSATGLLVNYL